MLVLQVCITPFVAIIKDLYHVWICNKLAVLMKILWFAYCKEEALLAPSICRGKPGVAWSLLLLIIHPSTKKLPCAYYACWLFNQSNYITYCLHSFYLFIYACRRAMDVSVVESSSSPNQSYSVSCYRQSMLLFRAFINIASIFFMDYILTDSYFYEGQVPWFSKHLFSNPLVLDAGNWPAYMEYIYCAIHIMIDWFFQ